MNDALPAGRKTGRMEERMALDRYLAREIKREAPKVRDRDAYHAFAERIREASADMSRPEVREQFDAMLTKHGRPVTAIVLAATLCARKERLEGWKLSWAQEVLDCWPHTMGLLDDAAIRDGLHPSRICEYAGSFIRLNEER